VMPPCCCWWRRRRHRTPTTEIERLSLVLLSASRKHSPRRGEHAESAHSRGLLRAARERPDSSSEETRRESVGDADDRRRLAIV
jgi:hypothetical protein